MGPNNGWQNRDHFITVVKETKENSETEVIVVNVSELARKLQGAFKKELRDFLKSEKIFENDIGIFAGLELPEDYEVRNILLDYFKTLNERMLAELSQKHNQELNSVRKKLGYPVEEKDNAQERSAISGPKLIKGPGCIGDGI